MHCIAVSSLILLCRLKKVLYSGAMADKKTEQICIRLEPEAYEKLREYAELEDRSVGYLVRRMIDDWMEKESQKKSSKSVKRGA